MRSDPRTTASQTALIDVARLRELHAAPKNRIGDVNHRYATQAQMDEFSALHDAFPALIEVAEAVRDFWQSGDDEASDRVAAGLDRFDFGESSTP